MIIHRGELRERVSGLLRKLTHYTEA
jgi:hypothetical protein